MKKNSKRHIELKKNSKDFKSTDLVQILELVKKNSTAKFDESIDVSVRIGLKQSKGGDFNLRTVTQLPAGTGKKIKVAVLWSIIGVLGTAALGVLLKMLVG